MAREGGPEQSRSPSRFCTGPGTSKNFLCRKKSLVLTSTGGRVLRLPRASTAAHSVHGRDEQCTPLGPPGGYAFDPYNTIAQPVICLLVCGFLFATMAMEAEAKRGACAAFLANSAGLAPYCLAVYLWQMPFSYYFYLGQRLMNVALPIMFFSLFLFSYFYTELVEAPAVRILRRAAESAMGIVLKSCN